MVEVGEGARGEMRWMVFMTPWSWWMVAVGILTGPLALLIMVWYPFEGQGVVG